MRRVREEGVICKSEGEFLNAIRRPFHGTARGVGDLQKKGAWGSPEKTKERSCTTIETAQHIITLKLNSNFKFFKPN